MRPRPALLVLVIATAGAASLAVPAVRTHLAALGKAAAPPVSTVESPSPRPQPSLDFADQQPPPPPGLRYAPVTIRDPAEFLGWALADRTDPTAAPVVTGSRNFPTGTSTAEMMMSAGIVADYLRQHPTITAQVQHELATAIVTGGWAITQKYYLLGGADALVRRLVSICGLRHTTVAPNSWTDTTMTPEDAVGYGVCLADGRAAGEQWTGWLLDTMRQATGANRAGIVNGLPGVLAQQASIGGGATFQPTDHLWHQSCLAILPHAVLVVLLRYAGPNTPTGMSTGARICASVASQLVYVPEI
jgi:hypothetical protein